MLTYAGPRGVALAFLFTLLPALPLDARSPVYYRWVDADGKTVHSDRPPLQGIRYEVVDADSGSARQVALEEGAIAGSEPKPATATAAAAPARDPALCQQARDNLATLKDAKQIRMRDASGNVRELSQADIKQQIQTSEALIRVNCER